MTHFFIFKLTNKIKKKKLKQFILIIIKGEDKNINPYGKSGLVIMISNETVDSADYNGIQVAPGQAYDIELTKYTISKQPWPYSNCLDDLDAYSTSYDSECFRKTLQTSQEISGNVYHFSDCVNMCRQKWLGEKCHFQATLIGPSYFDAMTRLDFIQLFTNTTNIVCFSNANTAFASSSAELLQACDCPLECQKHGYTYSISSSEYPSSKAFSSPNYMRSFTSLDRFNDKPPVAWIPPYDFNYLKSNASLVRIYFEQMTETVVSEVPKYQVADLVSSLGGTVGLFTGFSFLSLIELLEILVNVGFIVHEDKTRNKRVKPIESKPLSVETEANTYSSSKITEIAV